MCQRSSWAECLVMETTQVKAAEVEQGRARHKDYFGWGTSREGEKNSYGKENSRPVRKTECMRRLAVALKVL